MTRIKPKTYLVVQFEVAYVRQEGIPKPLYSWQPDEGMLFATSWQEIDGSSNVESISEVLRGMQLEVSYESEDEA